jgi:GNAT superfamily N-acetyltransferase
LPDTLVAALEQATVHAVSPDALQTVPGWLLPLDACAIGRAHSAVPLSHDIGAAQVAQLAEIEAIYRAHGLAPVFRLPDTALALHAALAQRGYTVHEPTWVMTALLAPGCALLAPASPVVAPGSGQPLSVTAVPTPTPAWLAVFMGPGFDPHEGASRAQHLGRASGTRFYGASLQEQPSAESKLGASCAYSTGDTGQFDSQPAAMHAVGAACTHASWVGVHGMRTAASVRGLGLATAILRHMAADAAAAGHVQMFLQVGAANPARHLYQRLGFEQRWTYAYWRKG